MEHQRNGTPVIGEQKKARLAQQEFAIGWLDRVGYRSTDGDVKISSVKFFSDPNLGQSDHAPVFLTAGLEFDPEKPEK